MMWFDRELSCQGCGKVTYRPLGNPDGCGWCGAALTLMVAGQLGLFATNAVTA